MTLAAWPLWCRGLKRILVCLHLSTGHELSAVAEDPQPETEATDSLRMELPDPSRPTAMGPVIKADST